MIVRVKLFAVAKQLAGRDTVALDLAAGATVAELRRRLAAELPQLANVMGQMTFSIGAEYARDDAVIPADADVACIPPVSGG